MQSVRLALLVADQIIRRGIEALVNHATTTCYQVVIFQDFESLLRHSETVDIVLMDMSGWHMTEVESRLRQVTGCDARPKVISISNRLTAVYIYRVMQSGALGFIYRDDLADCLLNSLELVGRDIIALSPQASQILANSKYLYMLNDIRPLDMQVLRLTASGMTVKEIAIELNTSTRSIYRSRDKLREILGVPTIETLIQAASEQGLLDLDDD